MQQLDWVGFVADKPPFKDMRNTRESVAEEKARLLLELGKLINKAPPHIATGGSIEQVREWKRAREAAAKVAASKRASVGEISSAINNMRHAGGPPEK